MALWMMWFFQSNSLDKDDQDIEKLAKKLVNQDVETEYMFEIEEELHVFYDG